jgi:hypothetical protein
MSRGPLAYGTSQMYQYTMRTQIIRLSPVFSPWQCLLWVKFSEIKLIYFLFVDKDTRKMLKSSTECLSIISVSQLKSNIKSSVEFNLLLCWSCITVYQYSETNVMHFLFSLLRIKGLYIFWALLAHPQEVPHKRHLVHCLRVMSVQYQPW